MAIDESEIRKIDGCDPIVIVEIGDREAPVDPHHVHNIVGFAVARERGIAVE